MDRNATPWRALESPTTPDETAPTPSPHGIAPDLAGVPVQWVVAERLLKAAFERNGIAAAWKDQPVGTPEDVAERLAPYVELGYRHLVAGMPATYDEETMTRLITEVKPILERGG